MDTQGGHVFFPVCSADSEKNKFVLTTHEKKNIKFSKPMECFMPEGAGEYLVRIHKGKTNLVSEMEKNSLLRKKNHSPPPPRVSNGPPFGACLNRSSFFYNKLGCIAFRWS